MAECRDERVEAAEAGQGLAVVGGDGALDFGDELDGLGLVGLGAPVGRGEQPYERDDLGVAGGLDGGVGDRQLPAWAVEAGEQLDELVVVFLVVVPALADPGGVAVGGGRPIDPVAVDEAAVPAVGPDDLRVAGKVGLSAVAVEVGVAEPLPVPVADGFVVQGVQGRGLGPLDRPRDAAQRRYSRRGDP